MKRSVAAWVGASCAVALSFGLLVACNGDGGDDNPDGPLPELWVSETRLLGSARAVWVHVQPGACSISDECAEASGWRRLLMFSTEIQNRGDAAVALGAPGEGNPLVSMDPCRNRPVVNVAPEQSLLDGSGNVLLTTRDRPFCWADSTRISDMEGAEEAEHPMSYQTCIGDQGISPGWSSIQSSNTDCQVLDVTELPPGEYTLRVTVDPDGLIPQKSLDGRIAEARVWLTPRDEQEVCIAEDDCHVPVVGVCEDVVCAGSDDAYCEGDVAVTFDGAGICHPVEGTCIEARQETDCSADGRACVDGECVDGCEELGCERPADYCDGYTAVTHVGPICDPAAGECLDPEIVRVDCDDDLLVCEDGVCVDLCAGVDCSVGSAYCEGDDLVLVGPGGECDWTTGVCEGGDVEIVECGEGEVCEDGACRVVEDDSPDP